ncbi:MAG: ATP synthase F0 subunit B [Pseudomonadota bacterium]
MRRSAYIFILAALFFGFARFLDSVGFWKLAGLPEPHGYLIQGFLFLGVLLVLQNTLFEPYVRILDEREEQTTGKRAKAEKSRSDADGMIARYRASITEARKGATTERERQALQAEDEERRELAAAKGRANVELKVQVEKIRKESDSARTALKKTIEPLTAQIVAQVMGGAQKQYELDFAESAPDTQ